MNVRVILFVIFLFSFLVSCASAPDEKMDYANYSKTKGLTVYPDNNTLEFTSSEAGISKNFILSFDLSNLVLLGIDNSSANYGASFSNTPVFSVKECNDEIILRGSCTLSIMYSPQSSGGSADGSGVDTSNNGSSSQFLSTGSIRLMFLDVTDPWADSVKYHELRFTEK